jgi:hypothetical protein
MEMRNGKYRIFANAMVRVTETLRLILEAAQYGTVENDSQE